MDPELEDSAKRAPADPVAGVSSSGGVGAYAGAGLQFAVSILAFLYLGQWLDRRFGTAPVCLLLGVFIGAAAGFYSLYRTLMSARRREEQEFKP